MLYEIFQELTPLIAQFCPVIGVALHTPLAQKAVKILADAFGVDSTDATAVKDKIANHPDASKILQKAEDTHAEKLQGLLSDLLPDKNVKSYELNLKVNMATSDDGATTN